MAQITIDGIPYSAKDGENLLQQCLSFGLDLPYFCWHPALHSVGACRQCAVKQFKDDKDTRGKLVMACMTPVSEGARISIRDPEAREFRASIIEWLMVNHPHDCPVCDEGGECHLQDMTLMTGHAYRRYRGEKRTFRNQDLGPLVNQEMNRCIQCYRCVRYYRDYAGGRDFDAHSLRNAVFFGREADGVLENEFSGNLVEICPTGVFTDKTLKRHYTRKWDLQSAPSVCVHCSVGCNTIPGERYGTLRRVHNRYNGDVNGYFLCDRGRYGYEFVNAGTRMRSPLLRRSRAEAAMPVTSEQLLQQLPGLLGGRLIGIGSPRASLEANFALRALVGEEHFYAGVSAREQVLLHRALALLQGPVRTPALSEVQRCDAVLILGEDVTQTAPLLALSLRQSVRQGATALAAKLHIPYWDDAAVREAAHGHKAPLFIAAPFATRLDDVAAKTWRAAPEQIARFGFTIAESIRNKGVDPVARALLEADRPLVVSGLGCGSEAVLRASAAVAAALHEKGRAASLSFALPECNSMGLAMMGGKPLAQAFEAVRAGEADTVVVLENDLYRRAGREAVDAFLELAKQVVVVDHTLHATSQRADLALPAGTFAESDGTLVNNEGRAQRFFQVFVPAGEIRESWRWIGELLCALGREQPWQNLDEIAACCAAAFPALAGIVNAAPRAAFRISGQKIAREPHRYSGRTAMTADVNVHEIRTPSDPDSALAFSMEGFPGEPPAPLIPYFWAPRWNSLQSVNKFQDEVGGRLRGGNPGVRLLEPGAMQPDAERPQAWEPHQGEWLVLPLHHIFGSEELSALAPGIRQLAPAPYLAFNAADAGELKLQEHELVELSFGKQVWHLRITIRRDLVRGMVGVPAGMHGFEGIELPSYGRIVKASS